jgi:hypothetical protein
MMPPDGIMLHLVLGELSVMHIDYYYAARRKRASPGVRRTECNAYRPFMMPPDGIMLHLVLGELSVMHIDHS